MASVILGLLAVICGGALYPVSKQSHTLGLIIGVAAIVFAVLGLMLSRQAAASDKDRTNKNEGKWLSIAGGILTIVIGFVVIFVK